MAIIRFGNSPFFRNPWGEFDRMRREFDSLFQNMDHYRGRYNATVFPSLNISEDALNVYIQAELPGVEPDKINVSVEGDTLNLSGERQTCPQDEKISYHRRELECGSFNRSMTLPCRIDAEKCEAKTSDGILLITLPKAAESKPRLIKVNGV